MVDQPSPRLRSFVWDCPDPARLAGFYAELLGGRVVTGDEEWSEVHLDGFPLKLAFQRVEPYRPPEWPDGLPQQMHLDLTVNDLEAGSRRAVELGATVLSDPVEEPGSVFVVHADPDGHPFCLCWDKTRVSTE